MACEFGHLRQNPKTSVPCRAGSAKLPTSGCTQRRLFVPERTSRSNAPWLALGCTPFPWRRPLPHREAPPAETPHSVDSTRPAHPATGGVGPRRRRYLAGWAGRDASGPALDLAFTPTMRRA